MTCVTVITPQLPDNETIPLFHGHPEEDVHEFLELCHIHLPAAGFPESHIGKVCFNYLRPDALQVYKQAVVSKELDTGNWAEVQHFFIRHFYFKQPFSVIPLTEMKMDSDE